MCHVGTRNLEVLCSHRGRSALLCLDEEVGVRHVNSSIIGKWITGYVFDRLARFPRLWPIGAKAERRDVLATISMGQI